MITTVSQHINCDLLKFHKLNPERYPFLLESVVNNGTRYSILFAFPQETIRSDPSANNFLDNFNKSLEHSDLPIKLPFEGGWFLYLDYELANEIEPTLDCDNSLQSESFATRVPSAIILDKHTETLHFVSEADYADNIKIMQDDLADVMAMPSLSADLIAAKTISEEATDEFINSVEKIKQYIVNGDVFQVNLSKKWHGEFQDSPDIVDIYSILRVQNPASFAGLVNYNSKMIVSSSPERLVKIKNKIIETRPIAGTRPRSSDPIEDKRLSKELLKHPKEQAEHIMLVDLERNDMGRVCTPGSIDVDELMVLETYSHVHHIVSNIKGQLADTKTAVDAIKAVFPGGTITGCPKVRCMQIIKELENEPRGAYTGSIGYLNHNGDMDLNILIRTIEVENNSFKFRTGAGIVHDSVAKWELKETRSKAKGILKIFKDNENLY